MHACTHRYSAGWAVKLSAWFLNGALTQHGCKCQEYGYAWQYVASCQHATAQWIDSCSTCFTITRHYDNDTFNTTVFVIKLNTKELYIQQMNINMSILEDLSELCKPHNSGQ